MRTIVLTRLEALGSGFAVWLSSMEILADYDRQAVKVLVMDSNSSNS